VPATSATLSELGLTGGGTTRVTGIALDSRDVTPGALFAALPGTRVHGAEFITYALRMGASAILTDAEGAKIARDDLATSDATLCIAEDAREALARAAALWYGRQPEVMTAVTGTNGKTSVASFARQIWAGLGHSAISFGTTGVEGDYAAPLAHTTPDAVTLHRLLSEAAEVGVTHGCMEASSHGLDQRRLDGVHLQAAGFTNLTQDHLDYHGDFESYYAAKAGLFLRLLPQAGTGVINIDDSWGQRLAEEVRAAGLSVLRVGTGAEADLAITARRFDATGQDVVFRWNCASRQVRLPLIGGFQAENVAVAVGLVIASGQEGGEVFETLPQLEGVRGRMELAATRANGAAVYVDYAHTPDAVATALRAVRPHVLGRLVCVLGAGGDRDTTKRKLMGEAAATHADVVFVTDDNPRSEDPAVIRAAVKSGAAEATEVADRAEAILRAVDSLEAGDTLLIAGKGHEAFQEIDGVKHPFDDVEQASIAVAALDGVIP